MAPSAATLPRMLDFLPNATAFQLGPLTIGWYGIGYAVGLRRAYLVMARWLARRAGEDDEILRNGMIIVAFAASIGGRAYHVIDQWDTLYKDGPRARSSCRRTPGWGSTAGSSPGRSRPGCTPAGGASRSCAGPTSWRPACSRCRPSPAGGTCSTRSSTAHRPRCRGASRSIAPTGSRTSRAARVPRDDPFPPAVPVRVAVGARSGLLVLIWIGSGSGRGSAPATSSCLLRLVRVVRFVLETLRHDNWTFFGVPTAQVVSIVFIAPALVILAWRHRPGPGRRPAHAPRRRHVGRGRTGGRRATSTTSPMTADARGGRRDGLR